MHRQSIVMGIALVIIAATLVLERVSMGILSPQLDKASVPPAGRFELVPEQGVRFSVACRFMVGSATEESRPYRSPAPDP
jgi:hypothetical protein